MKDSLFEMLMNFFEKSISQKESNSADNTKNGNDLEENDPDDILTLESQNRIIKSARDTAMRIFTPDEKMRFTKASYQFLSRLILWDVIASETIELIINQLIFSESRFVTVEETKWTIRNTLAENLDASQLAFLDLVLYQKEDHLKLH